MRYVKSASFAWGEMGPLNNLIWNVAKKEVEKDIYLSTDYFGTRQIIFGNNMNTIGNHFLYQVRGQIL